MKRRNKDRIENLIRIILLIIVFLNLAIAVNYALSFNEIFTSKQFLGAGGSETINLSSSYTKGNNFVRFWWSPPDGDGGWTYRLWQKNSSLGEWNTVSTQYNKAVNVLNVYPVNGADSLQAWMNSYGQGLINVEKTPLDDFNNNPDLYMKNSDGSYKYDVIVFGFWDNNGGELDADGHIIRTGDLSDLAAEKIREYINTGRGVLFGHDTIWTSAGYTHPNFNKLASYARIQVINVPWVGSTTVRVVKKGYLTRYPYNIETRDLTIPFCHSTGEYALGDIWIRYVQPFAAETNGPESGPNRSNNYYLSTWNNCGVIRTGHSKGAASQDEQMIIANVLFYLGQITSTTSADAYTAEDVAAPNVPDVTISGDTVTISSTDNGTEYSHYVTGVNNITGKNAKSNTVTNTVITGIKGYAITATDSEPDLSEFKMIPDNDYHESYTFTVNKSELPGDKFYIWVIDGAGNISGTSKTDSGRTFASIGNNKRNNINS